MSRSTSSAGVVAVVCVLLVGSACGDGGTSTNDSAAGPSPTLHPFPGADKFVAVIDNPYLPLEPGTTWTYEGTSSEGDERIVVTVTEQTRTIQGVSARVVRDTVTKEGDVIEDTQDWYAQDVDGNVWYLGEYSESYEDGETSTEGSWEAGKDGAQAGIVMLAHPKPGDVYRQEYYEGEAEDAAEVLALDATVAVPFGEFDNVLKTADFNPLEPDVMELKHYAAGIGLVYEEMTSGGDDQVRLVQMTKL